ncbi:Eco57I restriction-modification methylase domain-containing protein [Pontibacter vulgaris]|uniref:Eco57I restriction-modification methylase domain-containing protein n=1 Tax=Pontibacter vulgaris TaxID=2905679 RepID=UPI001FA7C122|nr:TaqI-like C-terminal specificity domain-containing protein [Pontibacter vulgaris]
MAFFQTSVTNKYLKTLDKATISAAYSRFRTHFHNPAIQENIRNSKEEQYQGEFLIDLFVNVLGYTKNPTPNYNLTTEHKNVKDSKKADGAILVNDAVKAVIELKGTNTTDLGKIEEQAFGYKNNQPGCVYVITSNFEKLRFYIDNAVEHLEFNLFSLTEKDFALLYLCLAYESIAKGTPKKIKDESVSQEDVITKQLYKDYSLFKRELYQNLVSLNPQFEPLDLFRKSQKLLDRFLFLFFAEDRQLLPPNSVRLILADWRDLQDRDVEIPLYDRFKKYFGYLNTGYKGKRYDVFAYNGGLFKADDILDTIEMDDELLYKHALKLSEYDFASEVDVNILGHIFENSLNELDEIKAQLEGQTIDKASTKRKKDGVFYTPKYITKYIVENTVGKLCTEKKAELQLNDEDYTTDKKRQKKTIKALDDKLKAYRDWLLQLTICDPACGSGAFLNQALDFLIAEHRYIDELHAKLFGDLFILSDVEKSILENNLFGVDLNEESVEIAKLSLWLRTTQPNRKLNDLNNNIKCGNSLIDDPEVAGDKAFNWQQAFPQVFEKGGFDVVIGNPPYVFGGNEGISAESKVFFKNNYVTGNGKVNLFTLFIEKSNVILKEGGEFSFIIPNTFLRVTSYHESRKFFVNNFNFRELADLGTDIFENAVTTAMILIATKCNPKADSKIKIIKDFSGKYTELNLSEIISNDYIITTNVSDEKGLILKKMLSDSDLLGDECDEMIFGVVITKNKDEIVSSTQLEGYKPFLEGKDISSYIIKPIHQYLNYTPSLLHRARTKGVFEVPEKLLVQRITGGRKPLKVAYDNNGFYNKESINNIILKPDSKYKSKFILTLLNSELINWFYNNQFTNESTLTVNISKEYLSRIPVKNTEQQPFIEKADAMLSLNEALQSINQKFQRTLSRKFGLTELPKKLQEWYLLPYVEFIKELAKKKVKLSLADEAEWEDYFTEQAEKALSLKNQIQTTDAEIDQLVYQLYNLTDEEIAIVEGREALAAAEL